MALTVVVGMSGSTGLGVVRALAAAGVACHAVHYDGAAPPMATRLARVHVSPDWREEPEALVSCLVELAGRLGIGGEGPVASLFVCHDAALHAVWAADDRLRAAGLRPAFASCRPLAELLDKRTQIEAARRAGVATPWTRWGPPAELAELADECPYPAILKPAFSHVGVRALGAKALRCASPAELQRALDRIPEVDVLLQEYVPGGDDQLYTAGVFVCRDGHVAFTGRKLKQHPPGLGIARLAESVDEPGLVPGSVALLGELGYEGVSQVEYKRDARDGSYRLMEANFRPWTWIGLATACGVNLPLAAHRWALAEGTPAALAIPGSNAAATAGGRPARWIWLVPEITYALSDLRRGVPPRLEAWRGLRAEAFFSRKDPLPFVRAVANVIRARRRRRARARADGRRTAGGRAAGERVGERPAAARRSAAEGTGRASRQLARHVAMALAAVANGAVLWRQWRRAGGRSVAGARPQIGLPAPGTTLVLAPHPDDETIMCGATLALLRERGDPVKVVAVTAGTATKVAHATPGDLASGDDASGIGGVRLAEWRAACAALGVDDLAHWDFTDGRLATERLRLAARIGDEIAALQPCRVVAPFPYDAHDDHVAVAVALADSLSVLLEGRPSVERSDDDRGAVRQPPTVLCGAVRMPFSPSWATRLVPGGRGWTARGVAIRCYRSRGRSLFATPGLMARLHPARPARAAEGFVELPARAYVGFVRAMERSRLTTPGMRGGGHPLFIAARLVRTAGERERVAVLLRETLSAARPPY